MRLPNHIAGGFCLTGFFSSVFFSINILASPVAIAAVVAGSLLPDIDNTKSISGKLFYPIARWLNRKFGHRTLTHSLVFIAALGVCGGVIERTFTGEVSLTIVLVIAWFVHVILDTFTMMGVQLMFPFSFEPYWMFERPEARIRNGDFKAEGMFFLAFIVLTLTQQNLWQNGFWTQFNQAFGTVAHLELEYSRSADALDVAATAKVGTAEKTVQGLLVKIDGQKLVLLSSAGFEIIGDDEEIANLTFQHTGKPLNIQSQSLINLSADSLNEVLLAKKILTLEIQANQSFQVTEANSYPKTVSTFAANYLSSPPVFAALASAAALDTFISDRSYLPQIEFLQAEIRRIQQASAATAAAAERHAASLAELRRQYALTSDVSERQRIHEQIQIAEGKKFDQVDQTRIEELQDQISKIQKEARFRETASRKTIQVKNSQELSKIQETRFTGLVTFLADFQPAAASARAEPGVMPAADTILPPKSTQKPYRVIGVKDGDTVEVLDDSTKTTLVIRLAHIDCPEFKQAFGYKAKQFTSDFCFGRIVQLNCTEVDRYGRQICVVFYQGRNLNLELVKAGFAWHYKKYSSAEEYTAAEVAARTAGLGLWSQPNPTPPWDFRKSKN